MNGNDLLDALRFAFLVGLLTGVPFTLAVQDGWREFKRWRYELKRRRERCQVNWDCLDEPGHEPPCIDLKDVS